jgi:hypothetical protein
MTSNDPRKGKVRADSKAGVAAEMIRKMPDVPTAKIASALVAKYPAMFPSKEGARDIVRYVRGNHGDKSRDQSIGHSVHKANGPTAYKAAMPKPDREDWTPFNLDGAKRVLVLSDIHIPHHCDLALNAAIKTGKRHKIDCILINGDLLDFYQLSRFQKDPKRRDPKSEIDMGCELLLYLKQQFPKARIVFKEGNHDERWTHYLWDAAPILYEMSGCNLDSVMARVIGEKLGGNDSAVYLNLGRYGIEFVDGRRPVMAGMLPILHGHELPKGMASPVNAARGAFMRTLHTIMIGHGHRSSQHVQPDMFHSEVSCWSTGCLCGLHPYYAVVNAWNHGWAVNEIADDGQFNVHNYRMNVDGIVRAS